MSGGDGSPGDGEANRRPAAFPVLLALFAALYAWRMSGLFEIEPVTTHLSNLYLSGAALTLLVGPKAFKEPGRRAWVLATAVGLLALNIVGEVLLALVDLDDDVNDAFGNVNTSDPVDGIYGVAGVLLVLSTIPGWRRRRAVPAGP